MKLNVPILLFLLKIFYVQSQVVPFHEDGKWGLRDQTGITVAAKYDTIYGFDKTGKVCLACFKTRKTNTTQLIKITTITYACNYFNTKCQRLIIRNKMNDTSSVFSFGRNTVNQFDNTNTWMVVNVKGKKHLVDKDFRQRTFNGYHNITPSDFQDFYICEQKSESDNIYTGLVNTEERMVIPFRYSNIKINTRDSLIIACSAGFKGTDDIYDYKGTRLVSSSRHISQASKKYLLQKIFEPTEKYFVLHRGTGAEQDLDADEALLAANDEILLRKKKSWFSYNIKTGEKKPIKQPEQ